jgi:hypothetical protein
MDEERKLDVHATAADFPHSGVPIFGERCRTVCLLLDRKVEPQRGTVICPRSHSYKVAESGLDVRYSWLQGLCPLEPLLPESFAAFTNLSCA